MNGPLGINKYTSNFALVILNTFVICMKNWILLHEDFEPTVCMLQSLERKEAFSIHTLRFLLYVLVLLKFIYSEKATKVCKISIKYLSYVLPVKKFVEISQNFVAFSEYMDFICTVLISGGSYCSFSLLHYSIMFFKKWIYILLIFITVLLFLLYVLF